MARRTIANRDADTTCLPNFRAEVRAENIAAVKLLLIKNASLTITHTTRHMAHTNPDEIPVVRQITRRSGIRSSRASFPMPIMWGGWHGTDGGAGGGHH